MQIIDTDMPSSGPGRQPTLKPKGSLKRKKKKDTVSSNSERQLSITTLTPEQIAAGAIPEDDTYAINALADQVGVLLNTMII
jgi:hypothetical protein